jgi:hypothetical protein
MNSRSCAVSLSFLLLAPAWAADEPALPTWNVADRKTQEAAGWVAGALLLSNEPLPAAQPPEPLVELKVEQPTAEEMAQDPTQFKVIPENFLPAYFAERPKTFLIDPQGLLAAKDYRDRLNFLNYHASDSAIDLFVYVIAGNQEIPGEVREEETIERLFTAGRPAAIVFYYLGAPQRSTVYLSPALTDSVSAADQRRALASSVMQAFEKLNPNDQLEAFLVQMSIRIYWMEGRLTGQPAIHKNLENADDAIGATTDVPLKKSKAEKLRLLLTHYGLAGGVVAGLLAAIWIGRSLLNRRARYFFPEFEVEPRLGGDHGAGVGAVISFSSAALPPALQRDQVPDYLRRV